jgi:lipopolysaccharide export LptBFGC system permease protein LptF
MALLTAVDRYLFRLIIVPLVGTLVIAAMLLLLEKMLNLFDFVVNEGGPVSVVWRMLGNLIPEYLSLGIPIGVTLGILLGFRRMAMSSELDALNSVGVGYGRMLRVPYLFAAFFAVLNFGIVGYLQPYSRYAYEGLRFELRSGALGASIKVGEFTRIAERTTLRVEQSFDRGADLRGVFVRAAQADGRSLAVSAARGQFLVTDDPDIIILRLMNGTLVHDAPGTAPPRVLTFVQHDLPIDLPAMASFRTRGSENLERTIPELWQTMRDDTVAGPAEGGRCLPPAHGAMVGDVRASAAGGGAGRSAQAIDLGDRGVPVGGDSGDLSQGFGIWGADGVHRAGRPLPVAMGTLPAVYRAVPVVLSCAGAPAGRAADRSAGPAGWQAWRAVQGLAQAGGKDRAFAG